MNALTVPHIRSLPSTLPPKPHRRQSPRGFVARRMDTEGGITAPFAVCQRCGGQIKRLGMAGVFWRPVKRDGDAARVIVLCKPECTTAPEFRDWHWTELSSYLAQLLFNSGIKTRPAWRALFDRTERL